VRLPGSTVTVAFRRAGLSARGTIRGTPMAVLSFVLRTTTAWPYCGEPCWCGLRPLRLSRATPHTLYRSITRATPLVAGVLPAYPATTLHQPAEASPRWLRRRPSNAPPGRGQRTRFVVLHGAMNCPPPPHRHRPCRQSAFRQTPRGFNGRRWPLDRRSQRVMPACASWRRPAWLASHRGEPVVVDVRSVAEEIRCPRMVASRPATCLILPELGGTDR